MYNCDVKIIDMIMGSGKTSAAINYINSADDSTRFLYITPYLDEVERIRQSCVGKHFIEPKSVGGSKLNGIKNLLNRGANIASTHALFQKFDREIIDICRANNYTLIMDEVADVIEKYDITPEDFDLMKEKFVDIDESTGFIKWRPSADDYQGKFANEKRLCDLNCLAYYGGSVMMWLFPVEVFNAFRNIYILTYMFSAQIQCYYYNFFHLQYKYIYVQGDSPENYHFTDENPGVQVSQYNYKELIHVLDDEKLNSIGDMEYSLSKNWYMRNRDNTAMKQLKNNITNYFINRRKCKTSDTIWTTFKEYKKYLTGKGYGRGFIPLNTRASNKYRERTSLAYPVNRYINTGIKNFLVKNNVQVDEDNYALSEMLQFIWRSAIRDGKEIWIYIPSIRMRNLLKKWVDTQRYESDNYYKPQ